MTIDECVIELRSIVRELNDIESSLRREFSGIGQDLTANCISRVAANYETVIRKLNNVNPENIKESYKQNSALA
ncbi:MAG: hypothetical protein LBT59_04065 [Clostridiales bacterium]|nr:hypothetical protein [Clostridiales bacterium]